VFFNEKDVSLVVLSYLCSANIQSIHSNYLITGDYLAKVKDEQVRYSCRHFGCVSTHNPCDCWQQSGIWTWSSLSKTEYIPGFQQSFLMFNNDCGLVRRSKAGFLVKTCVSKHLPSQLFIGCFFSWFVSKTLNGETVIAFSTSSQSLSSWCYLH